MKIERYFYTQAALRDMTVGGWSNIDDAIKTAHKRQDPTVSDSGKQNRTLGANIEVWEGRS
jgi:hypothetical protein